MLSRFQVLSLILLISTPKTLCKSLKMSAALEVEINRLESQLIKNQQEFKMDTKKVIQETDTTMNLFADDTAFKVLFDALMLMKNSLIKMKDIVEVSKTQLEGVNSTNCSVVKDAIKRIEENINNYLQIMKMINSTKIDLFYAKEDLSNEYFLNYMLMSDVQEKSMVGLAGSIEQFLKLTEVFVSNFQTNSLQIAGVLFKLKIKEGKRCPNIIEDYTVEIVKKQ